MSPRNWISVLDTLNFRGGLGEAKTGSRRNPRRAVRSTVADAGVLGMSPRNWISVLDTLNLHGGFGVAKIDSCRDQRRAARSTGLMRGYSV
ncbi:MAG: hypothetical protein JO142_04270 [Burkholderiales bacterium]|nr:hypothetical protein [Burkholderiales bacterium]